MIQHQDSNPRPTLNTGASILMVHQYKLELDDKGQLIQDITSTSGDRTTNVHWTGTVSENLVSFDGGFQMTLLPGGMCMGCPSDVGKSVAQSEPFHLEFCEPHTDHVYGITDAPIQIM
ncbi:hypothetical protein QJS04_geneDACA020456 [Acorus gramineus]|uniref:Uncharacterized protein n=1 Tax=Acorus gramineus TaxID=55184 RepID=A0AAV9AEX0_ACOGR|nr:hypothetical protein QJS04_geneDACA020456 [Acorus gramineus]